MIGTLGKEIIFQVNDEQVFTIHGMTREVSGRWTEHETMGTKAKSEFLGPANQTISLTITLSAALGVKPRETLDAVANMVERGAAEHLVIGSRPIGNHPFRLLSSSETWDHIYSGGELTKATLSLSLGEYV